jgi:hypothetical protein
MREILYKNLTGEDNKKRDLFIREVVIQDGAEITIERRCTYYIRGKVYVKDPTDLSQLRLLKRKDDAWKKKHFHIWRKHDSGTGEDRLICKVAGTFYAIVKHYVFCVAFVHTFKIDLEVMPISK